MTVHLNDDVGAGDEDLAGHHHRRPGGRERHLRRQLQGRRVPGGQQQPGDRVGPRRGRERHPDRPRWKGVRRRRPGSTRGRCCRSPWTAGPGTTRSRPSSGPRASGRSRPAGSMQVRLNGGAGNDFMTCQLSNDVNSVANYDVAVWGGAGTDTALFSLAQPGRDAHLRPGRRDHPGRRGRDGHPDRQHPGLRSQGRVRDGQVKPNDQ